MKRIFLICMVISMAALFCACESEAERKLKKYQEQASVFKDTTEYLEERANEMKRDFEELERLEKELE